MIHILNAWISLLRSSGLRRTRAETDRAGLTVVPGRGALDHDRLDAPGGQSGVLRDLPYAQAVDLGLLDCLVSGLPSVRRMIFSDPCRVPETAETGSHSLKGVCHVNSLAYDLA